MRLLRMTLALAALAVVTATPSGAVGGTQFHGIGFVKGCLTPTSIGDPYLCAYQVLNVADTAHDSLTFRSIVDEDEPR